MSEREIAAAPSAGLVARTAFNRPVHESHAVLTDLVRQRLGERHALVFSRPRLADGRIAWTTPAAGPIRLWRDLTPTERATLDPARARLGADLTGLVETLSRS